MRVFTLMLSPGLGGIETAFCHYAHALLKQGHEVVCCVTEGARVRAALPPQVQVVEVAQSSQYDLRALWQLHRILQEFLPHALMVHGKRAQQLARFTQKLFGKKAPLVAVLHRHRFGALAGIDTIVCVTPRLREEAIAQGIDAAKLCVLPNFLLTDPAAALPAQWHTPPVIGFLGRLVEEKGCDLFLDALALLRQKDVPFTAIIAGAGALQTGLQDKASALGLEDAVQWRGWVEDVAAFFAEIDLLCSPSRHESFGIVLLEAFAQGVPVVATRTVGASALIRSGENGLLCDVNAEAIASALAAQLKHPDAALQHAHTAWQESSAYSLAAIAPRIDALLQKAITDFNAALARAAGGAAS